MSLRERIWEVIRSHINSLVNETEDPEKLLEQAVMEMQDGLVELRQAVAQAIATQKRNERYINQHQECDRLWYRRAQLALEKGNETLAREALIRSRTYQNYAQALQIQIEEQIGIINKLKQDLKVLENKIFEAKTKKNMYIARARSAVASQKIQELVNNIHTRGHLSAFERMEEKVMQLEAYSQIISESSTDTLEMKFVALEKGYREGEQGE
jgi:phage shock protein A